MNSHNLPVRKWHKKVNLNVRKGIIRQFNSVYLKLELLSFQSLLTVKLKERRTSDFAHQLEKAQCPLASCIERKTRPLIGLYNWLLLAARVIIFITQRFAHNRERRSFIHQDFTSLRDVRCSEVLSNGILLFGLTGSSLLKENRKSNIRRSWIFTTFFSILRYSRSDSWISLEIREMLLLSNLLDTKRMSLGKNFPFRSVLE